MRPVELYFLALEKNELTAPEALIVKAYQYAEKPITPFQIMHEYEDVLDKDKLSDAVEDYCLAILSERAIPLERRRLLCVNS